MKNKKLGMLVKASILSRKGATIFFLLLYGYCNHSRSCVGRSGYAAEK